MINVLMAMELSIAQKLRQNFKLVDPNDPTQGYERNDLTNAQRKKLKNFVEGFWKGPNYLGTDYAIISMYFPEETVGSREEPPTGDKRLYWYERLKQLIPGDEFNLGAWDITGAQYGTKIIPPVYDYTDPENPVEITPETVVGTPVYNIPNIVQNNPELIFPDDVTYDSNGNETSRTGATAPKEVNKVFGWEDRRWS